MRLAKNRILTALSEGEHVYVLHNDELKKTQVLAIEDIGIDTELDFLPYKEQNLVQKVR